MERKSLFLAWVLNVVPGVGLIYVGRQWLGIFLIMVAAIFLLLIFTGIGAIIGLPLYLIISLIACITSVVIASNHNKSLRKQ